MERTPLYFMPGLAANNLIFERLNLSEEQFEVHYLEWLIPIGHESMKDYATRLSQSIKHENPVLIGVSFGGIIVQELSKIIKTKKVIIISSVKSNEEFPRRLKIAKKTKVYKLIPTGLVNNIEMLGRFAFGEKVVQRLKLYKMYLSVRDKNYLDWAIENVILWEQKPYEVKVTHIHGSADDVFPIKYISDCIIVKGGTHIMILNKYKWFNENLPEIILK